MNKELQKDLKNELIESFKVFYSSLYQHKKIENFNEDVKPIVSEINDLFEFADDVNLKIKFVCDISPDKTINTAYQPIQEFVKNGADLNENTIRFKVVIKAEVIKNGVKYSSDDAMPFFKSESFVLKENDKAFAKLTEEAIKEGKSKAIVVNGEDLQEFSNNRIRFGYVNEIQL